MVFSSYLFIFIFLPLALLIYYASPGKWKHLSLTIMSYIFYGWGNPSFVFFDVFHQHRGLYQRAIDDILSPAEKVVSDLVDCNQSDSAGILQVFQFRN